MVEKVFISPNRVRAYGNIVNMKTGDDFTRVNSELTVTTDTVNGAEMTVFQFGVEGGISIALVSSASACYVGDNVLLTATVVNGTEPVEAAEVTFKLGETTLGTDETDANGVATYTYTASTVGSFSFTASYQDSTSSVVSVSVNHSYSLSFSQSSYVATGGSATLECTLLEDNVAKSGASVKVTGTDSSTYTATTDNSGVASVTVTGISASTVFTATYQGVTATCTVTTSSIPYQTVEYLQSNGSQYINTGYILKAHDKVEVTVSMQGNGTYNGVFGARKNDYQHNAYALFGRFGGSNKFVYTRTGQEKSGNTINTNVIYDVTTQGSTCTIKQNGTLVQTLTNIGTIEDCVNPCGLFVLNTHTGTGFNKDTYGYMKIYSFKITDSNNNVIMDLVPVRDGTTGYMYDKVSNSLMTNNGTFLYGADI